jgi:hypothetical protein
MDTSGPQEMVANYRGTVRVHWRIRNHYLKGTLGGQMSVYADCLRFCGVGIHKPELRTYEIRKKEVSRVYPLPVAEVPRLLRIFPIRRYGIRVVSEPGGVYKERDEYTFRFDAPELYEVLTMMRAAGYPIAETSGDTRHGAEGQRS